MTTYQNILKRGLWKNLNLPALVIALEKCSDNNGGCDNCQYKEECIAEYDKISMAKRISAGELENIH